MSRIVLTHGKSLRPLPKVMWGTACTYCEKRQSRWTVVDEQAHTVCSICYLYQSPWAVDKRKEIDVFIAEVEASLGSPFARNSEGNLSMFEDADRILGAVVMTSRLFEVQDKVAAARRE